MLFVVFRPLTPALLKCLPRVYSLGFHDSCKRHERDAGWGRRVSVRTELLVAAPPRTKHL